MAAGKKFHWYFHPGRLGLLLLLISFILSTPLMAIPITGKVFTEYSNPLPFASIIVKGTSLGTTANSEGAYKLDLEPGQYTLYCQHIGYERRERVITVGNEPVEFNFVLKELKLSLDTIVIKSGNEDPANEIIRQAIERRQDHLRESTDFDCDVYIKGLIRLRKYPKMLLGQRVELEDNDTSVDKIIFLSETLARFHVDGLGKQKVDVLSTRVSGQTNSFGFANPALISLYENNIKISRNLNPRGFVSPLADNAFYYYRYVYEGAFFEDGQQINRIRIIPRRDFEPLFSGVLNIVENSWYIHSAELHLRKSAQLEFLNEVSITQQFTPVDNGPWLLYSQTIYPEVKQFGFDAYGHFTTHYSNYTLEPNRTKGFFDRTILRYDALSNKHSLAYWDSIRPLPLLTDELRDFTRKDSLEQRKKDPRYLDSLDRIQNRPTPVGLVLNGQYLQRRSKNMTYYYEPFLKSFGFNSVEGWYMRLAGTVTWNLEDRRSLSISPVVRYGFGNGHLNPHVSANYRFGKRYINQLTIGGGRRIYQFNNANPIPAFLNTFQTLFFGNNYMKIYGSTYGSVNYAKGVGAGFQLEFDLNYQNRSPLENTDTSTFWGKSSKKENLTPNYPTEISNSNIQPHQALVARISLQYRPGTKYVEFPDRIVNVGSKAPLFTLSYARGINKLLGSDVEFDRWRFSVEDNINMRMAGELQYKFILGGFINTNTVELPDYQHFNGNRVLTATPYLNSFQLAPYYDRSNKDRFFGILHLEHHFNGFLTNKIPLVKRANLRLVVGSNAFYTRTDKYYIEAFAGIDNIFKIFRIDYVFAYRDNKYFDGGIRIGIKAFRTLFEDE